MHQFLATSFTSIWYRHRTVQTRERWIVVTLFERSICATSGPSSTNQSVSSPTASSRSSLGADTNARVQEVGGMLVAPGTEVGDDTRRKQAVGSILIVEAESANEVENLVKNDTNVVSILVSLLVLERRLITLPVGPRKAADPSFLCGDRLPIGSAARHIRPLDFRYRNASLLHTQGSQYSAPNTSRFGSCVPMRADCIRN